MKYLITCLSLILLTSYSGAQSVTKTVSILNEDSLVLVPLQMARFMVQDIVIGDGARKTVLVQDSIILDQKNIISKNDSVIYTWKRKYQTCQSTLDEFRTIDSVNQSTINAWSRKYNKIKKQRNAIIGFAIVAVAGVIKLSTELNKD